MSYSTSTIQYSTAVQCVTVHSYEIWNLELLFTTTVKCFVDKELQILLYLMLLSIEGQAIKFEDRRPCPGSKLPWYLLESEMRPTALSRFQQGLRPSFHQRQACISSKNEMDIKACGPLQQGKNISAFSWLLVTVVGAFIVESHQCLAVLSVSGTSSLPIFLALTTEDTCRTRIKAWPFALLERAAGLNVHLILRWNASLTLMEAWP